MYQPSMPSSKPKLKLGAAATEEEELSSGLEETLAALDLAGLLSQQKSSSLPPQALNMSAAIITRENCFIIFGFLLYLFDLPLLGVFLPCISTSCAAKG